MSRSRNSAVSRPTSSQRNVWIWFNRLRVNMSNRMAVTAERVSEPSALTSFRTWRNSWSFPAVRNRSRFFLVYFYWKRYGLRPSLAKS